MATATITRKLRCVTCREPLKVVELLDSFGRKWICKNHGEVDEACTKLFEF